jgi:serine/threonine protein kinase/tetratricopeptide (TPR) repeat protein
MIGRTFDHYRILARLGQGGMGVVWRAYDERLHREVAIKMLPEGVGDAADRARLMREARAVSALNHPNVCAVYDAGEQDHQAYIVMELVEGDTLDTWITGSPMPYGEVVRIGVQVALALAHAHERGLVHRDLKCANVIVTPEGVAKVLDFGLARRDSGSDTMHSLTVGPDTIGGTPAYLSPEVLRGGPADVRSDMWSLGVMLYEMATGLRPYARASVAETLAAILHDPSPSVPGSLPSTLRQVITGCLEKDPARRSARAADVASALSAVNTSPTVVTAPTIRLPRSVASRPWAGAVLAAFGMVLVGGVMMSRTGCAPRRVNAIAVLPLANYSRDPDQQYFVDGMTDELTATLGQVRALRVIANNSVADYSPARSSIRDVARDLGVQAVVTGSVYRRGDAVRIVVQLVDAKTGRLMWAHSYDRALRDVLTLQNEVSADIADKIKTEVTSSERARLATARPVDPRGFDLYLRARTAWATYTKTGFVEAEQLYRQAIDRDPHDARAWAGLAQAIYGASSIYTAPNEAMPRSRDAAERAVAADSSCADAHAALGIAELVYDWNWAGAEREFRRAIALQPNNADAHWWLGHLLVARRRFDEGIVEGKRAQELDPLSSWMLASLGWHLLYAGRLGEAADTLESALRRFPEANTAHIFTGLLAEREGAHVRAVRELEQAVKLSTNNDDLGQLGHVYGTAGRRADVLRIRDMLEARARSGFVPASSFAMLYSGLGDRNQTMKWIERQTADHSEWTIFLAVDPWVDLVRGDPRFGAVLRQVGLGDVK